jgi:nucleoid-associated protein YgaU
VWSFKAVITSVTERYTLFRDDGTPVRATVDLNLLQGELKDEKRPQNPTTVGRSGYRQWIVSEGDTIDWIAFTEYGDASKWRYIADINNLDEPDRLRPGRALAIAPLP